MPCVWYQQELLFEHRGKAKSIVGVTISGVPIVLIGRSEVHAWGATVLFSDVSDIYMEEIEGEKYKVDGKWLNLKSHEEKIFVKGGRREVC